MGRKKKHEEHENHERWLVSYADFITLLFAFFVVMYALSSVNEGKFRVLSESLIAAFHTTPKTFEPIQVGQAIKAPQDIKQHSRVDPNVVDSIQVPIRQEVHKNLDGMDSGQAKERLKMKKIADEMERALSGLIAQDVIKVRRAKDWLEVEINTKILFASGTALLQPQAVPVLSQMARIVRDFDNTIKVEGFTDNLPINTATFPSNWELSAGRAASVVHLFSDEGVDPTRMAAIGYGEHRPIATNDTEDGRLRNRRVVVLILSKDAERQFERPDEDAVETELPKSNINLDAPAEDPLAGADAALKQGEDDPALPLRLRDTVKDSEEQRAPDGRFDRVIEGLNFPGIRPLGNQEGQQ